MAAAPEDDRPDAATGPAGPPAGEGRLDRAAREALVARVRGRGCVPTDLLDLARRARPAGHDPGE